jgi:hypothetical protein
VARAINVDVRRSGGGLVAARPHPRRPGRIAGARADDRAVGLRRDGRHLIVSGGLGCSMMPVRFGVPPEIVVVDIGWATDVSVVTS